MTEGPANKLTKMAKFISNFGYEGVDHLIGSRALNVPRKGRQKSRRAGRGVKNLGRPMYKSATSGFPRSSKPCGSVPAPTLDQVRNIERAYMIKIDVRGGLMYFKHEATLFSHEQGKVRLGVKKQRMFDSLVTDSLCEVG